MENKTKTNLTLIRGNEFPGGAMNTEIVQAVQTVHQVGFKSIVFLILDKIKKIYAKIWGPSEIEMVILDSIKNDYWKCSYNEFIKHVHFERKGLEISLATTKLTYGSWRGWSIYSFKLNGVDLRLNDKRILRYIVDFKLPVEIVSWGFQSDIQMLNAVRKTLE